MKRGNRLIVVIALALVLVGAVTWTWAQGLTGLEQAPQGQRLGTLGCTEEGQIAKFDGEQWACAGDITALWAQVEALQGQVAALESRLEHFSRDGDEIYITGANLHIVNGTGNTNETNGLGNVIIGYNESRAEYPEVWYPFPRTDERSGSHMLVVGSANNYTQFGGIVAGFFNTASGEYASISGGERGRLFGEYASISGGSLSTATGLASSVSGGRGNLASGTWSSVSGGTGNEANGRSSSVSGGYQRSVSGEYNWRAGDLFQDQ